ncbi:hypothetical protein [Hydrogenophaga luteola]|uniref:Uncharacterized protein n=1 Tax=Hydrogenophaga luteola TaxID=1591122 RepID=A0ABV7W094_9BURK
MFTVSASTLRRVLWLDAASGFGMGLSHLALAEPLSGWTGIPAAWLQVAALVVFGAASLAGWLASRAEPPAGGVRLLVAGNFAWVAASLWLAFGAGLSLTTLGLGWVLAQALLVLLMAELEWAGARRTQGLAMA